MIFWARNGTYCLDSRPAGGAISERPRDVNSILTVLEKRLVEAVPISEEVVAIAVSSDIDWLSGLSTKYEYEIKE